MKITRRTVSIAAAVSLLLAATPALATPIDDCNQSDDTDRQIEGCSTFLQLDPLSPHVALAYGLLYAGLRTTPSSAAVVASLLEPVTAALVAAAVLDERIGWTGGLGVLLVLAAVAGLGFGAQAHASAQTPVPPP